MRSAYTASKHAVLGITDAVSQEVGVDNIRAHDLTFGIGPAGTGKTYLAVASAVEALQAGAVRRIVLVRPAVEAGERLGFLPGDLAQKVDPYLRPMYDALYEMLGFDRVARNVERQIIEIARALSRSARLLILDEPTAALSHHEAERLFAFIRRLRSQGVAIIYITHRLDEVFQIADRVQVLR